MSRRHISQREAHRLEKSLDELRAERNSERRAWAREYPGGTHLGTITWLSGRMEAAQMLGHAIVAVQTNDGKTELFALPVSKR